MKCAGQDKRFWEFDSVFEAKCPGCGQMMEFFKDDVDLTCKQCGAKALNPKMDFGCATYCKYARECLGSLPPELLAAQKDLLKDKIAAAAKHALGKDFKLIGKTTRVCRYAEEIGQKVEGTAYGVLVAAALLHAVKKDQIREILIKAGAHESMIEEVYAVLQDVSTKQGMNPNSRILLDALTIYDLEQDKARFSRHEMETLILERLLTEAGREAAKLILFKKSKSNT
jgi:hypothetical protein